MKKFKNLYFYVGVTSGSLALMYWVTLLGTKLEKGRNIVTPSTGKTQWEEFIDSLVYNLEHPLAVLLAQIVTIIFVARFFGWVFKKIGQPTVIGEILAGIVLGPSLIGMYFPEFSAALFPVQSLGNLQFISQIGLILFMFIVGMELDLKVLKKKASDAVVISHASIVIPFALGMLLAYFIYEHFAPQGVQFLSFALFLGIAMSITAFPVLARIVQERGIHKTRLGTIVVTCAAADDITAWSILAAVIAIVKAGTFVSALYIFGLALIYVFVMIKIVRPFLKRVGDLHTSAENLSKPIVAIFFLTLIISAYTTEIIGIHALFGAFMAGAIMPENDKFRSIFIEKVEDISLVLLLPLFFVFTGLRTQIGLLNAPYLWIVTGFIILVAVVGKFAGSALAARYVGQSWKDSLTIGALMNTRGLMELVVLNIGYDLGVLAPEIFAMMVIMALTTTFMTGPAIDLINRIFKSKPNTLEKTFLSNKKYNILISFANPERGKSLIRLANNFIKKTNENSTIAVMHLSPTNELHHFNELQYQEESFTPIIEEAKLLNQKFTTIFKASNDIDNDITETANEGNYDILLVGIGQSIYENTLLGKFFGFATKIVSPEILINKVTGKENIFENSPFDERTRVLLNKSKISVGILIDKGFQKVERVFVPIYSEADIFLFHNAQKLIENSASIITFYDSDNLLSTNVVLKEAFQNIRKKSPDNVIHSDTLIIDNTFLEKMDLMLTSIDSWKHLFNSKCLWLTYIPSTLILAIKPK